MSRPIKTDLSSLLDMPLAGSEPPPGSLLSSSESLLMVGRRLGTFAALMLVLALGCSDEMPPDPTLAKVLAKEKKPAEPTSTKAQLQQAIDVSQNDPEKAIAILETIVKTAPQDRDANVLLALLSVVKGELSENKTERIDSFHRSFQALERARPSLKELNGADQGFVIRIELGEARALALEAKTAEALAMLKPLAATGSEDLDRIDSIDDFESLRPLPEFQAIIAATYGPKLAEATKQVAAELATAKPFPFDFRLNDLDDQRVTLADYRGKLTIVDFWGTWCPPCRGEIPHFVDMAKKYQDKGLAIVGINCLEKGSDDQIKRTIREFAKVFKIEYKCLINEEGLERKIPGFQGYPTTVFVDATGKPRLVFDSAVPRARLEAAIVALLAEGSKAP